ncbi:uncharacterized protein VP01_524g5 [Puccinia sorghi]|uniref:Uncharacterized protein n=1 Tax=Puccinia sorghi TaxID=27349 RepID=A0A0L6UKH9_9BASI|nr:uncharacterized protein VP01_524g5 [Puccinia sorghi]
MLAEGSNRRQNCFMKGTEERRTDQKLSRIISQASNQKPQVMRSLQTFTRAIMGLPSTAKYKELPTAASAEKQASWANLRERHKTAIKKQLQQTTTAHPNTNQQEIELIHKNTLDSLKGVTFRELCFSPPERFRFTSRQIWKRTWPGMAFPNSHLIDSFSAHRTVCFLESALLACPNSRQFCCNKKAHPDLRSTKRKIATLCADKFLEIYLLKKILAHLRSFIF